MGVKIVLLLFCALVIAECQAQFNNNYQAHQFLDGVVYGAPNSMPPLSNYINDGTFVFPPSSNNRYPRPPNHQKPQSGLVSAPNQSHFGASAPNRQSTQSDEQPQQPEQQTYDSKDSKGQTDFPNYNQSNQNQHSSTANQNKRAKPNTNQQESSLPERQTSGTQSLTNNQNPYSSTADRRKVPSSPTNQFGSSGQDNRRQPAQNYQRENEEKFEDYKPITDFSWNLFKNVNNPKQQNFVICPLSPQHLLSYLASAAESSTKAEIINTIRYKSPSQLNSLVKTMLREPGNKELQLASALFVSKGININQNFQGSLADDVEILPTDFSNTEQFNREYGKWVSDKTKGALSNARVKTDPSTRMLMSSAVYFKGEWIFKLNPGGVDNFYVDDRTPVQVNMMKLLKKLPYGKLQNGHLGEWIALPYNSNDSMVIIMPKHGVPLDTLIDKLNVHDIFNSMNIDNYGNVTLTLPRFKVESRSSLLNPLQQMGIRQLFSTSAQIPYLFSSNEPLAISNVLQQASLEVNEEGSIATSLTAFGVVALSFSPPTPDVEFKVDRPFVAMIIDRKNNFPYFIAKVSNPAA